MKMKKQELHKIRIQLIIMTMVCTESYFWIQTAIVQ